MKSTLLETHAPQRGGGGGGPRDWLQETTEPAWLQSNLELRLGISLSSNNNKESKDVAVAAATRVGSLGTNPNPNPAGRLMTSPDAQALIGLVPSAAAATTTKRWFTAEPSCYVGFIHPWSLAARQQKAAFEQAHQRSAINPPSSSSTSAVPRFTPPAPPPIVGWPPVRASRRNLAGPSPTKADMDDEKDAKKAKFTEDGKNKSLSGQVQVESKAMFVKVNMEGFAVGRKINLKAHDSYESLSRALQHMFINFLSCSNYSSQEEEEQVEGHNPDYILLYEDHEGDRMLVGDVPWELFITSVKRLYIAHPPKTPKIDDEKATDDKTEPTAI